MNSAVKNGKIQLNKTNYFTGLKSKAKVKDAKEQIAFNKEMLNCLDIICNRLAWIEGKLEEVGTKHDAGIDAIGKYLNDVVRPTIIDLSTAVDERLALVENQLTADRQDGGETMDV